jgi:hypothetical protein
LLLTEICDVSLPDVESACVSTWANGRYRITQLSLIAPKNPCEMPNRAGLVQRDDLAPNGILSRMRRGLHAACRMLQRHGCQKLRHRGGLRRGGLRSAEQRCNFSR